MKFFTCFWHALMRARSHSTKPLLVMKLSAILILISYFQVTASVYAQKISLAATQQPITKVFSQIQKQSGYIFFYDENMIKDANAVTLNVKEKKLTETLDLLFEGQPFTYEMVKKTIVVKARTSTKPKISFLPRQQKITGLVTDEKGDPLVGATVSIKGNNLSVITNAEGRFTINNGPENAIVVISYIGYQTIEVKVDNNSNINIKLQLVSSNLNDVSIVSTGYQTIPKERSTGSFVQVDNKLLNRRVSTDIISRLENVVPGLSFKVNKTTGKSNNMNIRGRSTIFANDQPLIVVDNFPYDGDIANINPNDIESISVLKDAAAASIWGARAGNGVIVLTTKKGIKNAPLQVNFNSNITIGEKPDLYYSRRSMSSSDFIDVEQKLFDLNFYNSDQTNANKPVISPVVEILIKRKNGTLSETDANNQINALRKLDVRDDYSKYLYRNSFNQQYALNMNGGSKDISYYFSGGFDKNLFNAVNNDFNRISLNAQSTITPFKNLDILVGISYVMNRTQNNNSGFNSIAPSSTKNNIYPYAQLASADGTPLAIVKDYRSTFTDNPGAGMLDWKYRPLDELNLANNVSKLTNARISLGAKYTFIPQLSAEVKYQYEKQFVTGRNLYDQQTYMVRDLINKFYDPTSTNKYPVPVGGILDQSLSDLNSYSLRSQVNYNQNWIQKHQLNAIAGVEVREVKIDGSTSRQYGYDDVLGTSSRVNYVDLFPAYYNTSTRLSIPVGSGVSGSLDRFFSYYANAAYTFNNKYTFSASGRKDASNLLGVKTNQKGVPLYSVGGSWIASKENFYNLKWLPYLKLRATFGYNGNVDKSTSAYVTALYANSTRTNLQTAQITNPPNPSLIWERTRVVNLGLDFATANQRISGTIEYFSKAGLDLIGNRLVAPSNGISTFRSNLASSKGHGTDITVNTQNLKGQFQWNTVVLFSYALDKVTKYETKDVPSNYILSGDIDPTPFEGRPLFSIYSYKWAGLDPATGDPQGYLNGAESKNYASILTTMKPQDLVYNGPSTAPYFGSIRNSFSYKGFECSFNISYKFGYYFRKSSVDYGSLFNAWLGNVDYADRWKQPGDEQVTQVPSFPTLPNNVNRDAIYKGSEILVQSGSHIRLQDIGLSYTLNTNNTKKLPFKRLELYSYLNNVGILWTKNKLGIDPDAGVYLPFGKTFSIGVKCTF